MPAYLEIAVNVPQVSGEFHYHLPEELVGRVQVGHLVTVPFGRQTVQGVVLRFVDQPAVSETRPVQGLVDPAAVLTPEQLSLAQALAEQTLAPVAACISLMLPPGLSQRADTLYELQADAGPEGELSPVEDRLLGLLRRRGPLRGAQIDTSFAKVDWRATARKLARQGVLATRSVLPPPRVQPKVVRTVQLACPPEEVEQALPEPNRAGKAAFERRQAVVRFLLREPGPVDVAWVYAESGANMADLRKLAELGVLTLGESEVWRNPLADYQVLPSTPPPLTEGQKAVWGQIEAVLRRAAAGESVQPMLLHGVTGSGKTEIYMHAAAEMIRQGRQAIILVPEIALTPQTVRRFVARFPGRVGLLHSQLTEGERYDTWRRARLGKLAVVVGPRSALFTPFPNLGLIVLDEGHDDSYYQQENPPHYDARPAAEIYARLSGAVLLYGSATPDIVSTYRASRGEWQYLHLPARILAHRETLQRQAEKLNLPAGARQQIYRGLEALAETRDLPPVKVLDMRRELQAGNRSIFSRELLAALETVLERKEQAILFLNRRGTATYVFCRDCGESLCCPDCEIPLTYHDPESALICHRCNYRRRMPKNCPACRSPRIRQYGIGTAKVEAELQAAFPQARILRWDAETTRHKGAHELILAHFSAHRADFLVGTQMLAKGLDLPLVTLVGLVLADVGLSLPDFRAGERAFQVMTQVAGRAGRSLLGGQVILQTFQPENYAIQAAAKHSYREFYQKEIEYRRLLRYPPFSQLVRMEYRHPDEQRAEAEAYAMETRLKLWIEEEGRRATQLIGPVPCFYNRTAGAYRWQIVLRGPDPAALLRSRPLGDWRIEVNPPNLL